MTSKAGPAATTIANWPGRMNSIALLLLGGTFAVTVAILSWEKHVSVPVVVTYLALVVLASIWCFYRGWRIGTRFDDHGVTVRKFRQTYRFDWHEVSRFEDGLVHNSEGGYWALAVVLHNGQVVHATVGMPWRRRGSSHGLSSASSKTLAAIRQAAERYAIPAA